jgi:integrase
VSARRKPTPSYLPHKQSGRARAVWTDPLGVRHQKLLPGPFDSPESRTAFARFQLELETSPAAAVIDPNGVTVAEVLAAYLVHAERYYTDAAGNLTSEVTSVKRSIKPVRELYAATPAAGFGPRALAAVRQHMIGLGWCRSLVNKRIDRVKRAFRWAVAEELVPAATYEALRTLPGLRRGRTDARESDPVRPVPDDVLAATLPHLPAHVRVMVELMRHTGMRPAEVCGMTLNQIDRTGPVWTYRPRHHKTAHHGKGRSIPLGPNAVTILTNFLAGRSLTPDAPVFSPWAAREERFRDLREKRTSPVQPSQQDRRKAKPARVPGERYTTHAITHAVAVAAKKAGVEHWHPYQLRHAHATRVRKAFGLEAAGATLGHTRMSVTEVYAERDEQLAATVAAKIG